MVKQMKNEKKKMNPFLWFIFAIIIPAAIVISLLLIILNVAGVDVSGWAKDRASSVPVLSSFIPENDELTIEENTEEKQEIIEEKDADIERLQGEIRDLESTIDRLNQDILRLENRNEPTNGQENEEEQASDTISSVSGSFKDMDQEQAALILQNLDEGTAISILNDVSNKVRGEILEAMDPEIAADLTQLLIDNELGAEGLKKSIVVVATSDTPALMRIKGAYTATAISEYFRDQGYQVNLMMDSVTRVAIAQREIGLATGEPPTTKGYTPSVFSILPKLLERAGTNENGTITGFYTVLVDGDDMNEPIADTVRGILDGHFIMDRKLAERGQYPAINVLKSISRVMNQITDETHNQIAQEIRSLISVYEENNELIQIGAYKHGTNPEIDRAISFYPKIQSFLKQDIMEYRTQNESIEMMKALLNGG